MLRIVHLTMASWIGVEPSISPIAMVRRDPGVQPAGASNHAHRPQVRQSSDACAYFGAGGAAGGSPGSGAGLSG